eukprot:CAMPEP_0179135066 /NCGR_PEP_ID=MMETSP0796-20121207/64295_1 /TAXON_ID=73915 /ORGANISM="Pyrodinium bahamense, Strain pbaha01" /LENGTH=117 /DNA_ID=CAMNT_0020834079 /DNA_START=69 /DNA_END=422 /DNA_ORIENTATION=+
MARRSALLPTLLLAAAALALFRLGGPSAFVPAPATPVEYFLEQAVAAAPGAAVLAAGALPALAEEIDSAEAYNRKVLEATAYCGAAALFLVGILIVQARKLVENKWLSGGGTFDRAN